MDIYRSPEMAESNNKSASGHEDNKGETHKSAVCKGRTVDFVIEGNEEWRDHHFAALSTATTTTGTTASAGTSTGTSSILLSARKGGCRLISKVFISS